MAKTRQLCWNPTSKLLDYLKVKMNNSHTEPEHANMTKTNPSSSLVTTHL